MMHATDLANADLAGRDLSGSDLREARFDHAILANARLVASDLRGPA